jgi:hypothetical protein
VEKVEKAHKALGKVERVALEAVAKAKVKEKALEAERVVALAKVQAKARVLEKVVVKVQALAKAVDRVKALEAVKVQALAKDKAKAKAQVARAAKAAKAQVEKEDRAKARVQEKDLAKAKAKAKVEKEDKENLRVVKVENLEIVLRPAKQVISQKIIPKPLCKTSQAICLNPNKRNNKTRLVMLLRNKPRKTMIKNLMLELMNVVNWLIWLKMKPTRVTLMMQLKH